MATRNLILPVVITGLSLIASANAATLLADGFDYGDTGGDLNGKNGGTGWSSAYYDPASTPNSTVYSTTGLTYSGVASSGGAVKTNDGSGVTTFSFRDTGTFSSGETWIGFLAQRNAGASATAFAGISFYNSVGTAGADAEFAIANSTTAPAGWRILDIGANFSVPTNIAIAENTTYFLVTQILWGAGAGGTDTVNLFVNPALGSTPVTASATRNVDMSNFNKIRIAGSTAVDYTFDEFRIGTSFGSVIPEPSAALLGGLGLLALLRRRRSLESGSGQW